ncbi:metalloregulator ArsR/SmtB family transcription factor [Mangrovibacter phragmitis]|uniref:metalloregulator ArsR/SmtB family transcription factor n=1 Tax=Mangrovibacter phragmitis TaxID=1691903 RepID=UPI00336ADF12
MVQLTPLALFKNLSDETRLNIILLLREMGEVCVCNLCNLLNQSQPKISRHLGMLRESGLLLGRKQGKWVHYRLSPQIPTWAAQVIEQAWLSEQETIQSLAHVQRGKSSTGCGVSVC